MDPKTLNTIKLIATAIAGLGVTKITRDIINNNVIIETGSDQIKVWIGTAVIVSMLASYGSKHISDTIDGINMMYQKILAEQQAATQK